MQQMWNVLSWQGYKLEGKMPLLQECWVQEFPEEGGFHDIHIHGNNHMKIQKKLVMLLLKYIILLNQEILYFLILICHMHIHILLVRIKKNLDLYILIWQQ